MAANTWGQEVPEPITFTENTHARPIGFCQPPRPVVQVVRHAPADELARYRQAFFESKHHAGPR